MAAPLHEVRHHQTILDMMERSADITPNKQTAKFIENRRRLFDTATK
jgi:hypothetical protein